MREYWYYWEEYRGGMGGGIGSLMVILGMWVIGVLCHDAMTSLDYLLLLPVNIAR